MRPILQKVALNARQNDSLCLNKQLDALAKRHRHQRVLFHHIN